MSPSIINEPPKESKITEAGYRLGDMVRLKRFRDEPGGRELHYKKFPDSIASEYMRRTDTDLDYPVLKKIIEQRTHRADQVPPKDMLLIHLRIGDVIDNKPESVDEFLDHPVPDHNGGYYVKPMSYYENILHKITGMKIHSITLIGGTLHFPTKSNEKSFEYVDRIKKFFETHGYSVFKRINFDADQDFIFMCNAEYFVPSGGGYSQLISEILRMRAKHVISVEK